MCVPRLCALSFGGVILVGLTGGIGSGKSTVSAALARCGAVIIDADAIVRELQRPGMPVLASIVERFGPSVLTPSGELDRGALAAIVFNDSAALASLNEIVHPAVAAEILRRVDAHRRGDEVVVLDVPLLVENNRYPVAGVIVVDAPVEFAVARVIAHRGMDEADAWARVGRQASREDRLARADFVVDNSGDLDDLAAQVDALWNWIVTLPAAPRSADPDANTRSPA